MFCASVLVYSSKWRSSAAVPPSECWMSSQCGRVSGDRMALLTRTRFCQETARGRCDRLTERMGGGVALWRGQEAANVPPGGTGSGYKPD